MSIFRMSRREKMLTRIAPISEKAGVDRRMRVAILRARRTGKTAAEFQRQQAFDRAVAELVRATPVTAEVAEWFRNEKLIPQRRVGWRRAIRNPVVHSIVLALVVITGVAVYIVMERVKEFPGSETARKMLSIASSTRGTQLDRIQTRAGALSDLFFMKYRLEHYNVPPEFAHLETAGVRVFDAEDGRRVAQISVPEQRMQFFLFPADRESREEASQGFSGWRFVRNEGWTGAVRLSDGVYFVAAVRGDRKLLEKYLRPTPGAAGR